MNVFRLNLILILFVGVLTGCLPEVDNGDSTGASQSAGFSGALLANAVSSSSIEIAWGVPTDSQPVGAFQVFEVAEDSSLSSVAIVPFGSSSYLHNGLAAESTHRYVVRGLYNDSTTDTNFRIVSATTQASGSGDSGLSLAPSSKTVTYNTIFQMTASGGALPYQYSVLSGPGSINPTTGEFVSLSSDGVATVRVEDASGKKAYASIVVVSGFTVSPETTQLKFNRSLAVKVEGATDPVSFSLTSGSALGTLSSSGVFTAGTQAGTVNILISDATGLSKDVIVTVVDQMIPQDNILVTTYDANTCYAIRGQSKMSCWGRGYMGANADPNGGAVGDDPSEFGDNFPEVRIGSSEVVDVQSGVYASCALFANGRMKCFGGSVYGETLSGSTAVIGDHPNEMGDSLNFIDLGTGRTVKSFSLKAYSVCAVLDDDRVKCWGYGAYGGLGSGASANLGDAASEIGDSLPSVDLGPGLTAKKVEVGYRYHTCAILNDNSVKCWGLNDYGQLGLGDQITRGDGAGEMGVNLPVVDLGTGRSAVDLALGGTHTCALLDNGQVKCWGDGRYGKLGVGDTVQRGDNPGEMGDALIEVDLGLGRTAVSISAGNDFTCALLDDNSIKCWGYGANGRLGNGQVQNIGDTAGEMGDSLAAVDLGFDSNGNPHIPAKMRAGWYHSCAITTLGAMKCWGNSGVYRLPYGSLQDRGNSPSTLGNNLPVVDYGTGRTVKAVGFSTEGTCALLDDNTLRCTGRHIYGRTANGKQHIGDAPGEVASASIADFGSDLIESIDVGYIRGCLQFQNGKMKCWGEGGSGALAIGSTTHIGDSRGEVGATQAYSNITTSETISKMSYGANSGCAILSSGRMKCWGEGTYGLLGSGSSDDLGHSTAELGDNLPFIDLGTNFNPKDVSVAYYHACALSTDGDVKCWGYNHVGQLGLGDILNRGDDPGEMGDHLPKVDLGSGRTAKKISTGVYHSCAILDNDEVKCWGIGSYGNLGYGTSIHRGDAAGEMGDNLPTVDLGSHGFKPIEIIAASYFTCVLFSNEQVKCWGYNSRAAAGPSHRNTPSEMGDNMPFIDFGQNRRVVKFSESSGNAEHLCVVLDNSKVKCWGDNFYGELGLGHTRTIGADLSEFGDFLPALDLPF